MGVFSSRLAALMIGQGRLLTGHTALWAGGCVRDMLLGRKPTDYDVATDAEPDRVVSLFSRTRCVGEQFGVVLVKQGRRWTEVATFRTDLDYADGRHPTDVVFTTAEQDARRRDFTVNGMFHDPVADKTVDYVGGREDLERRVVRAIGDPVERFAEDSLRMLRAVRFAAKLDFTIHPATGAAIAEHAPDITRVSAERIREELEKMLTHRGRARAVADAATCGLMDHLWPDPQWSTERTAAAVGMLERLPKRVGFPCALAALLGRYPAGEVDRICRDLTCSNDERVTTVWLVEHREALNEPDKVSLADLKLLMQCPAFGDLLHLFNARLAAEGRDLEPYETMRHRAAAIPADEIAPAPLVTGDDLIAMGYAPGPAFGRVLEAAYRKQLDGEIADRDAARALARQLLTPAS